LLDSHPVEPGAVHRQLPADQAISFIGEKKPGTVDFFPIILGDEDFETVFSQTSQPRIIFLVGLGAFWADTVDMMRFLLLLQPHQGTVLAFFFQLPQHLLDFAHRSFKNQLTVSDTSSVQHKSRWL